MIVVKLMGGLGNQMFQYAAARRAAWRRATVLKLNLSFLEKDQPGNTPRRFALGELNISATRASRWEVARISCQGRNVLESAGLRVLQRVGLAGRGQLFKEKQFGFDPTLLAAPDNSYLEGYWQSERYFQDIAPLIAEEFTVRRPLCGKDLELAQLMQATQAVSLHVRRGDYVSAAAVNAFHGACPINYYLAAVQVMASRLGSPHFFLFSDDPEWLRAHLKLQYPTTVVEHNGAQEGHQDLRLMSLCKHHIIANSSLSWWGAWLSGHAQKTVIAPRKWFNDPSVDTSDLIPGGWLRL